MATLDPSAATAILESLRHANDGFAITVWGGEKRGWILWRTLDARYAEGDPDWLMTISGTDLEREIVALTATGHPMVGRS